ncbi:DNA-3-methyladenine glycosylase 2 family protein [Natronoglycomyces albus]|uniref:DNA-3-methyladenine glycosylase II n=1 Tax=Natronoglycomyces albus TaxID=2811108 RepID=A0A895XNL9_9ACTN|nr:DNA-3-methyladenine glycosylase 2 family protein [Natronoglycomyces albus]QSB04655.1 DNA-3-methyladenine glycosylase 2 family protein [Natronoglycomyces albus]
MHTDFDRCLRAVQTKDPRFDGWFFTAVSSTGIYCRPSCPAMTPKSQNISFHPTAASAQQAGYRACKRCRPDASPGSPQWNERADLVARAMRLIADGVVDRDGVPGLARQLGYGVRQIERQLRAELGTGPLALARAQRAQTARLLIETTNLPMGEIAFAAGFASIRSFNDTVHEVFATAPTELRKRSLSGQVSSAGLLRFRLPFRQPLCPDNLFGHLAATAIPGVEEWRDGALRRTMSLAHGPAILSVRPEPEHIDCRLRLADLRDVTAGISRARWLLDLDADPQAIDAALCEDADLAALVRKSPGRRVPRSVDGFELAVRIVLGQQVSTKAAATHARRLVEAHGTPVEDNEGGLGWTFPTAQTLAEADLSVLAMPQRRRDTIRTIATEVAEGRLSLHQGADLQRAKVTLQALPGVGPWTVDSIAMRALGDPDVFLAGDLGIANAAKELGLPATPGRLKTYSKAWSPWRSYAVQYLWATLDHDINRLPVG